MSVIEQYSYAAKPPLPRPNTHLRGSQRDHAMRPCSAGMANESATPVMHKLMHHLAAGRYESPGVADRADEDESVAAKPPARGRFPVAGEVPQPRGRVAQPSRMHPGALASFS
jgi:hypothetical protein